MRALPANGFGLHHCTIGGTRLGFGKVGSHGGDGGGLFFGGGKIVVLGKVVLSIPMLRVTVPAIALFDTKTQPHVTPTRILRIR